MCKGRIPNQHGIVSQPIKRDAGRNDGIAIVDEHTFGSRKDRADFPILLAKILYVISHEWLRRALTDFRFVFRIEQHRAIGVGGMNVRNPLDKDRPPVDWAHGHWLTRLFPTPFRQGHCQRRFTRSILQDDLRSGYLYTSIARDKSTAFQAHIGQPGGI